MAIDEELDLRTNRFVEHWPLSTVTAGVATGIAPIAATRWIQATIGTLLAMGANLPVNNSARPCQQGSACNE